MLLLGIFTPTSLPACSSFCFPKSDQFPPKPFTMTGTLSFVVETGLAIVLFIIVTAFYTLFLLRLAVEYDRYIYAGGDEGYSFNFNWRIRSGLALFCLSILEICHAFIAFFIPASRVPGQMKLLALATFSLFAFIIATWLFGGYLAIRYFKQTDIECEPDLELSEIIVPAEEGPAEQAPAQEFDDSLDLD